MESLFKSLKMEQHDIVKQSVGSHSVEDFYKKASILHEKAIELHRERYKTAGTYDKVQCKYLLDDIRALARDITEGLVDLDIDFSKKE